MNTPAIISALEAEQSDIWQHVAAIYGFAKQCRHPLELGVRTGNSTVAIMCACTEDNKRLCSVDMVDSSLEVRDRLAYFELDGSLWAFITGDDVNPGTVEQVRHVNPTYDFILVDTIHVCEHTIQELNSYFPLLERGGIMAFHDSHTELYAGGVFEPVLAFISAHPECTIIHDDPCCNGLTAFQKS